MASPDVKSSSASDESTETSVSPLELPPTPTPTSAAVAKSPSESKASSTGAPLHWVCSEDSLPAAAFYGPLDAKNPLLASCEKEIRELLGFMKTKKALEYKLALLQCYGRYLQQFSINFDENTADVNKFKMVFFPKGFGNETATLTFRALSGKNICNYQLVCDSDVNLQNKESVSRCLQILSSLRFIMQLALPQEHLCWIIFNGTIYIYTICRKLMIIGYSSKALEYLLWASMCMESSVPLLSVRYLTWRATLYAAVCQCHYDCQASIHGEAFARRALAKIDELRQLELMSSSNSHEKSRRYYREATTKMAVMIFKRGVYESRRKNKVLFRPKIRINLKEAQNMSWPRTVTERLLDELFDSTASQFLAVLESLSDSSRRILQTGPLVTEEVELRDVVLELFMAGKELLILSNIGENGKLDFPKTSLLEHITERRNTISMDAAVKFTKLAFTYEEWGLFESLAGQLINFLKEDPESKKAEKDLILLVAVEPLINVKKNKGLIFPLENDKEGQSLQSYLQHIACHESCVRSCGYSEDIFHLAAILHFCVCVPSKGVHPDKEIVVDIIMLLWQKCKLGIQRITIPRSDYARYSQRIITNKWIYLLWQLSEVIHCYKLEDVDIVMVAEITLRLSEILESLGSSRRKLKKSADLSAIIDPEEFPGTPKGIPEGLPILKQAPVEQLFYAYQLLDRAIAGMNWNCMLTTLPNGSSIIDHCYVKCSHDLDGDMYKPISANSFMMDLHLELIQAQHHIAVGLLDQLQGSGHQSK
uniref:Cilia- and flagella-associated protein 54 n=1 Tax=Nannospalax galili TaxID=1026970 RepID=A0A8C6QD26_NANGA